jgi:hypothetical protein
LDHSRLVGSKAGVHRNTITRSETEATAHGHAVAHVIMTLEAAGVEFIAENGGGPGVRLKKERTGTTSIAAPRT